jgi:phosphoglycolate phosphatase-like HAD superfamily hydrolase
VSKFLNNFIINTKTTKAIFFDFDGVIIDSVSVKTEAFAELFSAFGEKIQSQVVEHHIRNGGMSRYEKIYHYFKTFIGEEINEALMMQWANKFGEIGLAKVKASAFKEGVLDFMETYQDSCEYHLISATPQDELEGLVKHFELQNSFRTLSGSPTKKAKHFERLLDECGYKKEEVIYIGDATNDFSASLEVGIGFVGVTR